jgi:hypothetical protein
MGGAKGRWWHLIRQCRTCHDDVERGWGEVKEPALELAAAYAWDSWTKGLVDEEPATDPPLGTIRVYRTAVRAAWARRGGGRGTG